MILGEKHGTNYLPCTNFSPFIIIEESYLQTFSHSLEYSTTK